MRTSGNGGTDQQRDVRTASRPRRIVRLIAACAASVVFAAVPPASASEAQEEAGGGLSQVRAETLPSVPGTGEGVWFWPESRRMYRLDEATSAVAGLETLRASDSDTGDATAPASLSPGAWGPSGSGASEYVTGFGRRHVAAVDRAGGRVFVAYGPPPLSSITERAPVGDVPCPNPNTNVPACVGGVHVIDGLSMASLGRMRLDLPTVEGARVWPILRALEYAPPVPERGWGGRVLMVVEEYAHGPAESSEATSASWQTTNAVARRNGGNVAYAVAFDAESMRQEWAVRLEGCRSSREPRNWAFAKIGDPTAVFRTGGAAPAMYVGCHGSATQLGVVVRVPLNDDGIPAALPVRVGDPVAAADPDAADGGAGGLVAPAARQEVFAGPEKVQVILADPLSQRILMRVDDSGQVWWVFDGTTNQFIGTIGIGNYLGYAGADTGGGETAYGLEEDIGRLYVQAQRTARAPGGLYVADIRRTPLAQALHYPDLASTGPGDDDRLWVMPRGDTGVTRIYKANIVDESPASVDAPAEDAGVVRTLDLAEAAGVTDATFDGTARGFGFRALLLGGAESVARVGPADPVGVARGISEYQGNANTGIEGVGAKSPEVVTGALPRPDPCTDAQRELIVAFVGPRGSAVVDASSARGETQPVVADVRTQQDAAAPVTRCGPKDWPELWQTALVSQPPMSEPGVVWPFEDSRSSCTASGEATDDASWSDPVVGMFSSRVACSENEVGGWGQARGVNVDGVSVANTLSSFQIYRDSDRGMVARVESIARGIDIGGIVKVDTIRGVAESWANGRTPAQDEDAEVDEDVFNPWNCDRSRPAGTCFERHVFGVRVASPDGSQGYRCGPCGDEDALIDGINRGLGANGVARFREPDRDLARGSADGYVAAVTKKDKERFSDIVLNADLLETMVPMLEIVRYAPHNRPNAPAKHTADWAAFTTGTPPRGRQVYQFAAVEVSSTYGIQCLLVYDEATNTCADAAQAPGSIQVSLSDPDGKALAGGGFEVRADVDGDGVVGLVDTLLPDGACVTAADGVGTCKFDDLQPGSYLVTQVAAPPGYAKAAEPFVVELASGEARTVAFTNTSNMSVIAVSATDEAGAPVAGAVFAVYPDPDADGKIAPDTAPAATCTTGADGACQMSVAAGSYVLVQTSAPGGLAPIEPVAFTFATGGQTAAVGIVNYPADSNLPQPQPAAAPVYTDPVAATPPVETIDDYTPPAAAVDAPRVSLPDAVGGTIVRVIRAPGDALRLLSRDPQQAVAFTAALLLFALAVMAVRRRQLLGALANMPALAFTGGHGPSPRGGGPGRPPSGGPSTGPSGGSSPRSRSTASNGAGAAGPSLAAFHSGATGGGGTAVLERRAVAGAAPSALEGVTAAVTLVTSSPLIAALVADRLAAAEGLTLVDTVDSLDALRRPATATTADILIVDLSLSTEGSDDICDLLPRLHPPARTLGLIPAEPSVQALAARAYRAGFGGLLAVGEDLGNGQLAYAVRCLAVSRPCFGPSVQAMLMDSWGGREADKPWRPAGLSDRELEVARLAAAGMGRRDIAKHLFVSEETVKLHVRAARKKLGVNDSPDRALLRQRLADFGLLDSTTDPAGH